MIMTTNGGAVPALVVSALQRVLDFQFQLGGQAAQADPLAARARPGLRPLGGELRGGAACRGASRSRHATGTSRFPVRPTARSC
jgi:hypothetical protein